MAYTAPVGLRFQRIPADLETTLTKTPARFAALLVVPVLAVALVATATRPPVIPPTVGVSGTGSLIVSISSGAAYISGYDFSAGDPIEITFANGSSGQVETLVSDTGAFRLEPGANLRSGTKIMASDTSSTALVTLPAMAVAATADQLTGTAAPGANRLLRLDGPGIGLVETMLTVPASGEWSWSPAGVKINDDANIYLSHQDGNGSAVEVYLTGAEALAGFSI